MTNNLSEIARIRDLAPEMLSCLEALSRYEHVMEEQISAILATRIRNVIKDAHND